VATQDELRHDGADLLALEREPAGQAPVRDDRGRPQIGLVIDVLRAHELLGAHVRGRAEGRTRGRAQCVELPAQVLGDAEVEDLDDGIVGAQEGLVGRGAARGADQEQVARLDVPVQDAEGVRLVQALARLDDDGQRGTRAEAPLAVEPRGEAFPLEQLHDHVRGTVAHLAVIEGAHDVGAVDLGRGHGLAVQTRRQGGLPLGERRIDELDGNLALEPLVARRPHRAHAPAAQHAHQTHVRRHHRTGL
jgi:hypothetical protein